MHLTISQYVELSENFEMHVLRRRLCSSGKLEPLIVLFFKWISLLLIKQRRNYCSQVIVGYTAIYRSPH